jgi:hypothetical protein
VLTGNQQPDHRRISEFRRRNLDALKDLFVQILRLCQKAGMVSLGHVALDGTKVQANASKHKSMSHERMLRAEKELEKEINALMRKAEILDAQTKAEAARETAIEAAENAGLEPPDLEPLACDAMPRRGLARRADGTPAKKTQRNFTDADSHLMQSGGTYLQGYNCQLAVDSDHQVIVAVGVSNQPPDVEHLVPMLQRITAAAGALPEVMTLDAGYWSEDNANTCADKGIDAYIATGRLPHGQPPPPQRGPLPRDADAKTRMARKLRSKKGSAIYAQRKAIVEPVNGQIKECRGIRRFLLRGLEKVDGEWHLIAATHNLLKLFRYRRSQQQAQWAATG